MKVINTYFVKEKNTSTVFDNPDYRIIKVFELESGKLIKETSASFVEINQDEFNDMKAYMEFY